MKQIYKYPRTHHIEGSKYQYGDYDLNAYPINSIKDKYVVVEEKVDGANCAISFSEDSKLQLQSRGHYLTGGIREKHFDLFKQWTNTFSETLFQILGKQFIMYGEWLYAKHTIFYTKLPHFFLEFDIFDKKNNLFLSTKKRQEILKNHTFIHSVKVLHSGAITSTKQLHSLIGPSHFISHDHINTLRKICELNDLNFEQIAKETDQSNTMEGLYIKVEEHGEVLERYKFIRGTFLTTVLESESHWLNRPIIPNVLKDGTTIFSQG